MALQGGIEYNATIQQEIDDHVNDPKFARFVITLKGRSGSFKVPKNARLTLIDGGDVTLESNEGHNEVSFNGCKSVTVKSFKNGVLRIDACQKVEELTTDEAARITVANSEIQKVDVSKSELQIISCEVQEHSTKGTKVTSYKNTFKGSFEAIGGSLYSEKDTFEGDCSIKGDTRALMVKPQFEGDVEIEAASVVMQEPESKKITHKSGILTINGGSPEEITVGE